jgi:hypothetical protein
VSNYPDNFSIRRYDATVGGSCVAEPPLIVATAADIKAMALARWASALFLDVLNRRPWTFDSTEIPPHRMLMADTEAFLRQMDAAIAQARASMEAGS